MAEPKQYLKCSAKARTFDNGGTVIRVGVKADELIAFAEAHRNAGGYLNLVVGERREPGQYGDTHSVWLDTWEPKPKDAPAPREPEPVSDVTDSDIPF